MYQAMECIRRPSTNTSLVRLTRERKKKNIEHWVSPRTNCEIITKYFLLIFIIETHCIYLCTFAQASNDRMHEIRWKMETITFLSICFCLKYETWANCIRCAIDQIFQCSLHIHDVDYNNKRLGARSIDRCVFWLFAFRIVSYRLRTISNSSSLLYP